uniref:Uncharacterized protein n=1 Tax=Megaselia scalaris TaxID=36166 RepID=T1H6W6_MEGSC
VPILQSLGQYSCLRCKICYCEDHVRKCQPGVTSGRQGHGGADYDDYDDDDGNWSGYYGGTTYETNYDDEDEESDDYSESEYTDSE